MSVELKIFKVFCIDRDKHLLHHKAIEELPNLERELRVVFKLLTAYYGEYEEVNSVSAETFLDYYELRYPKSRDKDDITTMVLAAFEMDTNEAMLNEYLDQIHEKHTATKLVNLLMPIVEGTQYGVVPTLGGMIEDYVDRMANPPAEAAVPEPCRKGIRELIQQEVRAPGLSWRLPLVNHIVGAVRPATLGLIYAFVDSGKTSFMLDNVAAFSEMLGDDEIICYAGNEEVKDRLRMRVAQAFLKQRIDWIDENIDEAEVMLEQTAFHKVEIFDDIVSGDNVKYILKNYRPRVLVVDQATDVDIATKRKADGVEYMKQLFKWYRRLANEYHCGIIGVSQGVGDAENTKWLRLSDIYGSRVAIQGALDYAIGIGRKVDDPAVENLRYINIPKNKLNGGEGGRITTYFQKTACLWKPA